MTITNGTDYSEPRGTQDDFRLSVGYLTKFLSMKGQATLRINRPNYRENVRQASAFCLANEKGNFPILPPICIKNTHKLHKNVKISSVYGA